MDNFQGEIDEIRDRESDELSKPNKTEMLTWNDLVDVLQTWKINAEKWCWSFFVLIGTLQGPVSLHAPCLHVQTKK
jgi:hypothetical protein